MGREGSWHHGQLVCTEGPLSTRRWERVHSGPELDHGLPMRCDKGSVEAKMRRQFRNQRRSGASPRKAGQRGRGSPRAEARRGCRERIPGRSAGYDTALLKEGSRGVTCRG